MADESGTRESTDSLLEALVKTPGAGTAKAIAPGTLVDGQYEIVRALGQGGMGVVYLARDQRLDRDVALKLGHVVSESALGRIEREAVALARLQHPNVVVIHQVGEIDGRLYIAMEHVAGGNAREWLAARARTWREIVAMYCAAGDGLAAAHEAGFVHRDFKPDNVLVGADGRPRVADFGLVRGGLSGDGAIDVEATVAGGGPISGATTDRMTATGAVVGTPAYMAPEQIAGEDVDARADQFAFCAALWEALFAGRPYPGKTPAEIATAIETTAPRLPADARGVPRHVIAALRRGLDRDRAARWPSMPALLAELRRDRRARRRVAAIAIAAAAIAAGGAYAAARSDASVPCRDGASIIASTWSPARAQALATAFDKAGVGASWTANRASIDHYASAWAVAHDDACRATRVDGSQSEAILDRRELCLARGRDILDATLDGLAAGGRRAIANAGDALRALPDLSGCADVAALANLTPLPADPAARLKVDAASRVVHQATVAGLNDTDRDPMKIADRAVAAATDAGWQPLIAEAMLARADVLDQDSDPDTVMDAYQRAADLAFAGGDERTAAWALADLGMVAAQGNKPAQGARFAELARALWTHLGKPADLGVRVELATAAADLVGGDTAGALAATRRQVALSKIAFPDNPFDRADDAFNLSMVLEQVGQHDEAHREMADAVRTLDASVGADHPILVGYLVHAAETAQNVGQIDQALAYARRALAIAQKWYGPDDVRTGDALGELGLIAALHGDPEEARGLLERASAIGRGTRSRWVDAKQIDGSLAVVEARTGHDDRAIEITSHTIDELGRAAGGDARDMVPSLITRGISERNLGRLDTSRRDFERALALLVAAEGDDGPDTINARIELSYTLVRQHHANDAVALLEPHLAAAAAPDFVRSIEAELHTALADALWAAGGDRTRARALAAQGRAIYAKLGDAFTGERDRADAWLAAHR